MTFLIDGKISGMGVTSLNGIQIFQIILLTDSDLEIVDNIFIFLFEHLSKNAVLLLPGCIIFPIMLHFINKEKRKDFDAFME